jgi:LysR family transcriptional regulator, transcription activator of glutamate synthase operon
MIAPRSPGRRWRQQVRRLEAELGTELFERNSRTVMVTEAGAAVAARPRSILAEVDGVPDELDELRGLLRGRVSVGATLPAGELDVPQLLVRFSEAFPGIEVDLHEGTASDMRRFLAEDTVDAAFSLLAADPPADIEVERLGEEEVVAAFPAGKGPDAERVTAAELGRYTLVTPRSGSAIKAAVDDFFARAGEPLRISLESGDPFLLRCLVSTGFDAAVLRASLTRRGAADRRSRPAPCRVPAGEPALAQGAPPIPRRARVHRVHSRPGRRRKLTPAILLWWPSFPPPAISSAPRTSPTPGTSSRSR